MVEKRKLKRRHLIYYLRVYSGKSKTPMGYMADIHSQGMMLVSDDQVKPNQVFKCRMELPQQIGTKTQVEFVAKSLWSKKGINADFYESGFALEEIDQESIATIESAIRFFGFKD